MSIRLAVLGGSSPFTLALFEALVDAAPRLPKLHVFLFGRRKENADAVADYARPKIAAFGWTVAGTSELADCLSDADLVVHQIRYGGMEGRRDDEELCARFGVHCDETLGLGGMNALLRTARQMRPIGESLNRHCKNAWVLNLTNPLSAVTTLLSRQYALSQCLGLCELPVYTAATIARRLGAGLDDLQWAYTGLNHRGFIHNLVLEGRDALPDFIAGLPSQGFNTIPREWIEKLNAVPLKYFALLIDDKPGAPTNRANYLIDLSRKIFAEMRQSTGAAPASLGGRDTPWYRQAVLPAVLALAAGDRQELVASVPDGSSVTREKKIAIERGQVRVVNQPAPPAAVADFLQPLVAHESSLVRAALAPDADTIRAAVALDPLIPRHRADECAAELVQRWS
jgi:6-phospho-beta-glucosidase